MAIDRTPFIDGNTGTWGTSWDKSSTGFPDCDSPNPFPDGTSATGWGTSNSSTFSGVHYHPGGVTQYVSKIPGGGGLTGDIQSDDPRLRPEV
jgi:hypothetical protein